MELKNAMKKSEQFVLDEISRLKYPDEHPFNGYPNTPESMPLQMLVVMHSIMNNDEFIKSCLKKCKAIESGSFSHHKYFQAINEVIWLYYMIVSLIENNSIDNLLKILDENICVYDNNKKFEYSLLLKDLESNENILINSEVKTLLCDPFTKEIDIKLIDGQKLVKPLFPKISCEEFLSSNPDAIELQACTHYYQTEQNIKRIINKCRGKKITDYSVFNIGIICINMATSLEEFYSYLFHKTKGVYSLLLNSEVDALVLISLDAHNDKKLDNIYSMGYIQTALIKPTSRNYRLCKLFRMDNYISQGNDIFEKAYLKGQKEYEKFKILNRDGFVNIIPIDASEEEIQEYINFLKSDTIRY